MLKRAPAVDSHDVAALRTSAWRTRLVRLVLAAGAVAALAAATSSARGLDVRAPSILPKQTTGVVVLDLSLSITDADYADVRRAVRRLIAADARIGLVIFSDVPYELLPPGTPARELRPLLRLLTPAQRGVPANPWTSTFRLGTRISTAIELAREMLERDRVQQGSILLVSDLQTAPEDVLALTRTVEGLRGRSISLRVVPLSPLSDGRLLFERLIGKDAFVAPTESPRGAARPLQREIRYALPTGLLVLAGVFLAALAVHEGFTARLALPRREYA